jgi:hypothetical protein
LRCGPLRINSSSGFEFQNGAPRAGTARLVFYNAINRKAKPTLCMALGADAVDIGKTMHPQPTLGELIGMAA